jgi:mRNA interferase RelE/StbE
MTIEYSKQAVKDISRLDSTTKKRIKKGIDGIPSGDIKKLQGNTELYRLRVGIWRILFTYPDNETILIEEIAPRGGAYKGV